MLARLNLKVLMAAQKCNPSLNHPALFGTAIADLDGIYNPSDYNDRLLLGLKGTMSEAELHLIKQR
ncbi:MAG: hypothetical protein AAFZ17_05010, partial [Cyanobacteria bacterium J06650_10]